ncbi:VOC family protein [Promicromonospora kroppenstedtii]|uniref:VOC family protein n=1 Tax=Promicromonospora kroppenstedtii TaxID=440482 RepID=UPI0004AF4156|nr:VOC family protein [Promicromonospora kroppenstedtii]
MSPVTVVVSLPVTDLERTLRFYRDGLGLETPGIDGGMIAFELPNLSLFLIEQGEYATYVERAGHARPVVPQPGAVVLSCAMGGKAEIDDVLASAREAGGSAGAAAEHDGAYTGYVSDPDGHAWELVFNDRTAAAAAG